FLSLKWRTLLVFSLVLLAINISFSALGYRKHLTQFEAQRESARLRYSEEVDGLLMYVSNHLQQLGGIVPSLSGMSSALISGEASKISRAFDDHWALLQFDMGIDAVRFYNKSGEMLLSWKVPDLTDLDSSLMEGWIRQVEKNEYPITALDCSADCRLYAIVPMLANGRYMGTILLGSSLAEIVVNFKHISGVDIGLILPPDKSTDASGVASKVVPEWDMKIVAFTELTKNMPALKRAAQENPNIKNQKKSVQISVQGRKYEVILTPLKGLTFSGAGYWVFIEDITRYITQIESASRQSLQIGFWGVLFSELVLLSILWEPMSRLRRTALALPLLARSSFDKSRSIIGRHHKNGWSFDEIDVLDDTSIRLSYQLEKLEDQVQERARKLAKRMEELAREKDFVTHLLHSCQVIILTQNRSGEILMMNRHAELLTGYKAKEMLGRQFSSFLPEDGHSLQRAKALGKLFLRISDQVSYESKLVCKGGMDRHISWHHSLLAKSSANEPVVLTVGLDLTKRKQAELRIAWFANHDSLTGLLNRRSFQKKLDFVLAEAVRYTRSGALFFLDLDHLKHVNDTSGHQAGDALLKAVAKRLRLLKRKNIIIGRLGGDEFAIVFPDISREGAIYFAKKINSEFAKMENRNGDKAHNVSASIGIALFPEPTSNSVELLANADLAMYQARDHGRGRWHLFSRREQAREQRNEVVFWKREIERGLARDSFELFFQPIVNTNSRLVTSYEVLLRMRNGEGKILTPEKFIGVAERTGIVQTIDRMVLTKAIEQLSLLVKQGVDVNLSVNLSGHSLKDGKLGQFLKILLKRTCINPKRLNFEITETAALSNIPAAQVLMRGIKGLGCSFSLDDFGTGYASFDYLKQLPVDHVKIDQSFISQLSRDTESLSFVKGLTEILLGFKRQVVAEGVEDSETMDLLQKFGVESAQGFYLGKSVSDIKEYYYRK
ncbi:MAG: EAL domain-containing protein, partial [Nitrospinota bacterium]